MIYPNSKALTVKIPRVAFTTLDQDHMLDVVLACAYPAINDPASFLARRAFEEYIVASSDSEICPKMKEALANLTEEDRALLFR